MREAIGEKLFLAKNRLWQFFNDKIAESNFTHKCVYATDHV